MCSRPRVCSDCLDPRHCHFSEVMGLGMAGVPPHRVALTPTVWEGVSSGTDPMTHGG